jgi:hypothetical protein
VSVRPKDDDFKADMSCSITDGREAVKAIQRNESGKRGNRDTIVEMESK